LLTSGVIRRDHRTENGSKKVCGNYRGISLLCTAVKIKACVILNRVNEKVTLGIHSSRSIIEVVWLH